MTWPSACHLKVTVTLWKNGNWKIMPKRCEIAKKAWKSKKKFFENFESDGHLRWRHSKWPWPSASHFKVTVTCERVTVTSLKWRADGQSQYVKVQSTSGKLNDSWYILIIFWKRKKLRIAQRHIKGLPCQKLNRGYRPQFFNTLYYALFTSSYVDCW